MRQIAATFFLVVFASVSTFGSFVVIWCLPTQCIIPAPSDCRSGRRVMYSSCGAPARPCTEKEHNVPTCPTEEVHYVGPIALAMDPSQIPCCAKVCASGGLSDFKPDEDLSLPVHSAGLAPTCETLDQLSIADYRANQSLSTSVHISIPYTVLRL